MSEVNPVDEVSEMLGLAVGVIDDAVTDLKSATEVALSDERFDEVSRNAELMEQLRGFESSVHELVERWSNLWGRSTGGEDESEMSTTRLYHGRVERGSRTPEAAFRAPILRALAEAGGSAPVRDALDRVGELMSDRLNDVDRRTLPSDDQLVRWRNTAQWARNSLADAGYIERGQRGTWTITESGRAWLEKQS